MGSLYLHCDHTVNGQVRLLLDAVFGRRGFRNEIVWRRSLGFKRSTANRFPQKNDVLLFYGASASPFNTLYNPHSPVYIKRFKRDLKGRLYRDDINPTNGGRRTIYLTKGNIIDSLWIDIPPVNPRAYERTGYPTQKPIALLERIIKVSSNQNIL